MPIAIDVGNTSAVLGKIKDNIIVDQLRIKTESLKIPLTDITDETRNELLKLVNSESRNVLLSGVVPQAMLNLKLLIEEMYEDKNIILVTTDHLLRLIKVELKNPYEVGDDRIINAIASLNKYNPPLIIIDFGTATTFDIINNNGAYSGGLICPGINLSLSSLSQGTALLPLIEFKRSEKIIGKSTVSAMESGSYWGYVSLIEGIVERLKNENECNSAKVVATGGHSSLFKEDVNCIDHFEENLTLEGLNLVNLKINEQR